MSQYLRQCFGFLRAHDVLGADFEQSQHTYEWRDYLMWSPVSDLLQYTHALVMLTVQRVCCYYASGFVCITRLGWLLLAANTAKQRHIDSDGITNKYVYKHYYSNVLDKTIYMTKTLKINANFDDNTNRHQNSI